MRRRMGVGWGEGWVRGEEEDGGRVKVREVEG